MAILVSGTLLDPMGDPSQNTIIRVKALTNNITLMGMEAAHTTENTDPDKVPGKYRFNLVEGDHRIEINFSDEFQLTGEVRIPQSGVDKSLPQVLNDYKIPTE